MNAWKIGKIFGIQIKVHWTFLLLPAWIYFSSILAGSGLTAAAISLIFVFAIFGCVLLHELGHALAARQFGIGTRGITILPIGGVAALERMPRQPHQELWIAVAGPLVNVGIAALILTGLWLNPFESTGMIATFFLQLALANVILVVFNMIPAFPMDGGRVLRSILAMFIDWKKATSVAVSVGKVAAIGLGLFGLISGNFIMIFIAMFVFMAGHGELLNSIQTTSIPHQHSQHSMPGTFESAPGKYFESGEVVNDAITVPSTLSASSVAAWLENRRVDCCNVVEHGRVIGTITKSQLIAALARGIGHMPVSYLLR